VAADRTFETLEAGSLESRLRDLAGVVAGDEGIDELEMRHLLEILTRSSLLIRNAFDPETLSRLLEGELRPASLFGPEYRGGSDLSEERLLHLWKVPDTLRNYGDKCLYDVGLAGLTSIRGFALEDLGPRAYNLTSRVLEFLADDRTLREFYERNLLEQLPIDEEILFLRQCASRFRVYAQILQAFRTGEGNAGVAPAVARSVEPIPTQLTGGAALKTADDPPAAPPGAATKRSSAAGRRPAGGRRFEDALGGLERDDRLTLYERALLFSALNLNSLRESLKEIVVEQPGAVDQLCDDLGVHALGTQRHPRPQSYFLVGPTGVGKNYLMETLARVLEAKWHVEVPFLVLEGAQYTYPSDVSELKGSTRGFIRSDEEGILAEFHERARRAPLSILLIDEVEKAHPQLARFFLSLMDRGVTMDNRGRLLRFPATILAFTSNLGYSEPEMRSRPIGYEGSRGRNGLRHAAARHLRRGLPPEFINRLQVIHFAPLAVESAARIVDQEVGQIARRYRALHGIEIRVTAEARRLLVEEGFSEEYGARHLVSRVDRVCNVEVSLRLHAGSVPLTDRGVRLLERIREARAGERAVDEPALQAAVEKEIGRRHGDRQITVDRDDEGFTYRLDVD
jgi:MoxR-like ATPase